MVPKQTRKLELYIKTKIKRALNYTYYEILRIDVFLKGMRLWDQHDPDNDLYITLHTQPKFECF